MTLISTARALDDQRFLWRVRSAALNKATDVLVASHGSGSASDGSRSNSGGNSGGSSSGGNGNGSSAKQECALAEKIVKAPMAPFPTLESMVAADDTIAEAIMVDEYNTVNTDYVTDDMIIAAVDNIWPSLARICADIELGTNSLTTADAIVG